MAEYYGKGCKYFNGFWNRDIHLEADAFSKPVTDYSPVLVLCSHKNNPEDHEGNCNPKLCPLGKTRKYFSSALKQGHQPIPVVGEKINPPKGGSGEESKKKDLSANWDGGIPRPTNIPEIPVVKEPKENLYYVQNGFVGNSLCWWRKGSGGDTIEVDNAEVFTEKEARGLLKGCPDKDFKIWDKEYIDMTKTYHVMSENIINFDFRFTKEKWGIK